ncbi:MAG: L,D-transpeptidase [Firmicutes bacterium]|nr:L,D-transpeptidase [Bacillota bacterium]
MILIKQRVIAIACLIILVIALFVTLGILLAAASDTKPARPQDEVKPAMTMNANNRKATPLPTPKKEAPRAGESPTFVTPDATPINNSAGFVSSPKTDTENPITAANPADDSGNPWLIIVSKSRQVLDVYYQNQKWGSYHVELGDGGLGDKQMAGDHKTPEGIFYITEKSVLNPADEYLGTRWMRLSYPNAEDAARGLQQGLISAAEYNQIIAALHQKQTPPQKTALGGGIGIHGGDKPEFNPNWTWGCVGLSDRDIEEFFDNIPVGTTVLIQK